ncbi:MAG: DUF6084 family protein [Carbonactinosporaceae bacterium]
MSELVFDCFDARPQRYAASPTLTFRLRVSETTGQHIHMIALRCQIRVEPAKRRYSAAEADRLRDLFGATSRWGDTLKPFQFVTVPAMVPGFRGSTELELAVPCTYDLEVAAGQYFHALDDGEIPLLLLFSGTVFTKGPAGLAVEPVPWHKECGYRLPARTWRELMDLYFPNSAWLRLRRETVDALARFKSRHVIPTWDDTFEALLERAGEEEHL